MTPEEAAALNDPPDQWSPGRRARYSEVLKSEMTRGETLERAADLALREVQLRYEPAPSPPAAIDGWSRELVKQWEAAARDLLMSGMPLNERVLNLAVRIVENRVADRLARSGVSL